MKLGKVFEKNFRFFQTEFFQTIDIAITCKNETLTITHMHLK